MFHFSAYFLSVFQLPPALRYWSFLRASAHDSEAAIASRNCSSVKRGPRDGIANIVRVWIGQNNCGCALH